MLCENYHDQIIHQKLIKLNSCKINNEIWFIGSPLVEQNILDKDTFNNLIAQLKKYTEEKKCKLIYILHRFETQKNIETDIRKFDMPIEIIFPTLKEHPCQIISCYSSGLINLASTYYGVEYYYIDISHKSTIPQKLTPIYQLFHYHENLKELQLDRYSIPLK